MPQTKIKSRQIELKTPYGYAQWANNAAAYSHNTTTYAYIDSTNAKTTFTVENGGVVIVDLFLGGIYSSAGNVYLSVDIGLDGNTAGSATGAVLVAPASWVGNMGTSAANIIGQQMRFIFTNVSAGSHTFYPLWRTANAAGTIYIAQYAYHWISAVDLKNA